MSREDRAIATSYSGLINQAAVAGIVAVLCFGGQELLKRRRRGKVMPGNGLGSVESWEFGYLYQARSWAKNASPPPPKTWPLAWVKEAYNFPEEKINELRGVDAAFYVRFLRGCFWWALAQTVIIFPILFPIHYLYSPKNDEHYSKTSLLRADISSLVSGGRGRHLLWIHLVLIYWVTLSWMFNIWWIVSGTLKYRAIRTAAATAKTASGDALDDHTEYHAHPHPQFGFQALPPINREGWSRGLRHRTIIVTNLPVQLRSERELQEYFEYYLSRHVDVPAIGLPPSVKPGLINRLVSFIYNRAKKYKDRVPYLLYPQTQHPIEDSKMAQSTDAEQASKFQSSHNPPLVQIDRVTVVRKMTELAALMHRREDVLVRLETAHIKLARKALEAVKHELRKRGEHHNQSGISSNHAASQILLRRMKNSLPEIHVEEASGFEDDLGRQAKQGEGRMDLLVRVLGPFVNTTGWESTAGKSPIMDQYRRHPRQPSDADSEQDMPSEADGDRTVWDALLSLPRSTLDAFQPLIHLNRVWRGKTVPAIDYYAAKLNVLNSLILELRAIDLAHVQPASTAFVTFKDPADARRACKYLTVHPGNPLACLVTMAPCYEDLDWTRLMKTTYRGEIVKDWVVGIGVWGFTIFWLVPVSLLLGLVKIEEFEKVVPGLGPYFERHRYLAAVVSSFVPTVFVAGLAILVPLILLLIAKKAHTIITLSELHDRIMTRYYKWLILNVLIFFCTGTTVLTSFFERADKKTPTADSLIHVIQSSFPGIGPFYVGWLIFTTAMHGGFEIVLLGLPLIVYPTTRSQVTPRKRNVGIRPRTLNYYYWLPNHLLVIHVLVVFAILNPLVLPFGLMYFAVERAVLKNQLLHVYAKHYEGNGKLLIIRLVRYSFDGLMLAQVVFIAYMSLEKITASIALGSLLLAFTILAKLVATRLCRNKFEKDDLAEAVAVCGDVSQDTPISRPQTPDQDLPPLEVPDLETTQIHPNFWTWRFPGRISFGHYTNMPGHHVPPAARRQPIPFGSGRQAFTRLRSMDLPKADVNVQPDARAAASMPVLDSKGSGSWPPSAASVPSAGVPSLPPVEEPASSPKRMVNQHAPHPAWDDESDPSQPYDNPYVSRETANLLWLPRDPLGILNLDDTVDMFKCLTSAPGLGSLGYYDDEEEDDNLGVLSMLSAMESVDERDGIQMEEVVRHQLQEPFLQSNQHLVESPDGMMSPPLSVAVPDMQIPEIQVDVPEVIRVRERTETDIEDTEGKPAEIPLISKRISISDTNRPNRVSRGPSSSPRRPTTTGNQVRATSGYRSFSGGSRMSRFSIRSPSSHMSGSDQLSSVATPVTEDGFSTRPAFRNQASFTRSTLTIIHATSPASDVASVSRRSSRASRQGPLSEAGTARFSAHTRYATSHVTAHEAVIEEAIAEERDAAEVREAKEQQEAEQAEQGPAWWKAWAFTNTQASQPPPSMAV